MLHKKLVIKYLNGSNITGLSTTIGLKNYNRNFMVDDFTYRFSKQHKDVNKDLVKLIYDNSIVNLIPYNNFKVNDGTLFNGSGFYVSKVDPLVYNQYQANYNRTTDPDLKTYYGNALKVLNTKLGTINLESSKDYGDKINETFSHENRHYYDDVLPGLNLLEISKLSEAYPKLNVDKSKWLKEATATNTELRRAISLRNNNVIKEDLDQVINNMSDQDLYNMYTLLNGYSTADNYYFRNKNQEFLDYQKTPEYKDLYLPYVKYRQLEDALLSDLNAYDYALEKRFGMIALDKAKLRTKQAKLILKQRKKSNYQAPVFPESVINMYNKYHKANLNELELDPNKMQKIRTALKDVAYNYRGNVNYAKLGSKLIPKALNGLLVYLNPKNWGLTNYNTKEFSEAFALARKNNEKEFIWKGNRYHTKLIKPKSLKEFDKQYNWIKERINNLKPEDIILTNLDSTEAEIYSYKKDLQLKNSIGSHKYNTNYNYYQGLKPNYKLNYLDSIRNSKINTIKNRFNNYDRKKLVVTDEPKKGYSTNGYHDTLTGKIYLNLNTPGVVIHEFSHLSHLDEVPRIKLTKELYEKALLESSKSSGYAQPTYVKYSASPFEIGARLYLNLYLVGSKNFNEAKSIIQRNPVDAILYNLNNFKTYFK